MEAAASPEADEAALCRRLNFMGGQTPRLSPSIEEEVAQKMRVILRVRPHDSPSPVIDIQSNTTAVFRAPKESEAFKAGKKTVKHQFTRVMAPKSTQTEVYEVAAEGMVRNLMKGKNGLLFAYGITNSGKTYTIHGTKKSPGLIFQALEDIMSKLPNHAGMSMSLSYMEIYNEKIFDLFREGDHKGSDRPALRLMLDRLGEIQVKNLSQVAVSKLEDAVKLINKGGLNRHMAHTKLHQNSVSSRSHVVFTITLHKHSMRYAKLSMVDLAGAERVDRSGCTSGVSQKELININRSLHHLGRCLENLRHNQTHAAKKAIPFRDSQITLLFKDSLLGDGDTVMIATANPHPEDYDETVHAMRYTSIASEIKILPKVNTHHKPKNFQSRLQPPSTIKKHNRSISVIADDISSPGSVASLDEGVWEFVKEKEEKISELLDQLYDSKKQLVKMQAKCVQVDIDAREQVGALYEAQIEQMRRKHKERLQQESKAIKEHYEKLMLLRQKQYIREAEERGDDTPSRGKAFNENMQQVLNLEAQIHDKHVRQLQEKHDKEVKRLQEERSELLTREKQSTLSIKDLNQKLQTHQLESKSNEAKLNDQLQTLNTQVNTLRAGCAELQELLAADRESLVEERLRVEEYSAEAEGLRKSVSEKDEEISHLNTQVEELTAKLETVEGDLIDKSKQLQSNIRNLSSTENQLEAEKDKIASNEGRLKALEEKLRSYKQKLEDKTKELKSLQRSMKSQAKQATSQQKTLHAHQSKLESQDLEITAQEKEIVVQKEEIAAQKEKLDELKCVVKDKDESIANLNTLVTELQAEMKEMRTRRKKESRTNKKPKAARRTTRRKPNSRESVPESDRAPQEPEPTEHDHKIEIKEKSPVQAEIDESESASQPAQLAEAVDEVVEEETQHIDEKTRSQQAETALKVTIATVEDTKDSQPVAKKTKRNRKKAKKGPPAQPRRNPKRRQKRKTSSKDSDVQSEPEQTFKRPKSPPRKPPQSPPSSPPKVSKATNEGVLGEIPLNPFFSPKVKRTISRNKRHAKPKPEESADIKVSLDVENQTIRGRRRPRRNKSMMSGEDDVWRTALAEQDKKRAKDKVQTASKQADERVKKTYGKRRLRPRGSSVKYNFG